MTSSDNASVSGSAARRIQLRNDRLEGEACLFLPRWTTPAKIGRLLLAAITAACLVGAVVSALAAAWGWVILLILVGLVVGGLLLRDARTMPYDGGVWLTPTRVVHQWGGRTWAVGWNEILDQRLDPQSGDVQLDVGAARGHGPTVAASTHLLVMSGRALAMVVGAFADDPAKRAALGTETARAQAEEIRELVDSRDFQPTVHRAPRLSFWLVFALALVGVAVLLGLAALGRASTIDEDDLASSVQRQLQDQDRAISEVSCEDDLRKEVGESVRCHGTEAGRERTITVRVTSVDGDRVSYDIQVR